MSEKRRVLMICLGNICRSPIAEAVFADYIAKNNLTDSWEVDSAALIGYHTGKSPDSRAMSTLRDKGITNYSHRARPITAEDFDKFDKFDYYLWAVSSIANIRIDAHVLGQQQCRVRQSL